MVTSRPSALESDCSSARVSADLRVADDALTRRAGRAFRPWRLLRQALDFADVQTFADRALRQAALIGRGQNGARVT